MNKDENIYGVDFNIIENFEPPEVFFSEEGTLKKEKKDFQLRVQQKEMSEKIFEAFSKEVHLFAEAGTGTGKSFAYLYPAIIHSLLNEERIVISTQTIALQEQVYLKDLPYLERVLGISLRKAIAKGRGNYICLRKISFRRNDEDVNDETRDFNEKISTWLSGRTEGDKEELSLNYQEKMFWLKVSSSSEDCFGVSCPKYKECYYFRQKRKIEKSAIIITNHSLLIRDLKMNNKILPEYGFLVIDEGHNFPDEFINQYTNDFDFKKIGYFVDGLYKSRNSLLRRLEKSFAENIFYKDLVNYIEGLKSTLPELSELLKENLEILQDRGFGYTPEKRITEEFMGSDECIILVEKIKIISAAFKKTADFFTKISQVLEEEDFYQDIFLEIRMSIQQINEKILILNDFAKPDLNKNVYWKKDRNLFIAPLEVSQLINNALFVLKKSVIVTSATLTVNKKFDFIVDSFGMDREKAFFLKLDSPFDFKKQAKFIVLRDELNYSELSEYIGGLVENFRGGSMILFTNHDFLRKTYYLLHEKYPDRIILADGISGSRRNIMKLFRESTDSILLGADSFWEGIDLEGDNLNNLVMTKLPFLPPNRPIVEATLEKIEKNGGNNFYEYSIPKAIIKFRQGFGRLIRSQSDTGNFYLLDNRIISKNYGKMFINSIPEMDKYLIKMVD